MDRRGFLGVMLAAASAPAIVKAENLMKIVVPKKEIVLLNPLNFGNELWVPEEQVTTMASQQLSAFKHSSLTLEEFVANNVKRRGCIKEMMFRRMSAGQPVQIQQAQFHAINAWFGQPA